jgi:hypothetical protein
MDYFKPPKPQPFIQLHHFLSDFLVGDFGAAKSSGSDSPLLA